MRLVFALVLSLWTASAAADLYRWVDPETGSVKFSSYPPPWYGDPAQERRAPKVEHIPAGRDAAAKEPLAGKPQEVLGALEVLRKSLLLQLSVLPGGDDVNRAAAGFKQQLETYQSLAAELDRMDPKGADRRRAENQTLFEKLLRGR